MERSIPKLDGERLKNVKGKELMLVGRSRSVVESKVNTNTNTARNSFLHITSKDIPNQ